jgi:imidazole glycerol-phosphate synthase subunit HisF
LIRIIPRLDIKGPNLVKGVHLEGLRVLGKPEHFARYYYETGADELMFMDAVASLYGRNSLDDIISKTAKEIFIPMTVGGGLRSVQDIRTVLRAGADKVSINTAAIKRPDIIREAAWEFGSSTIIVSIEARQKGNGTYEIYTDYGREPAEMDAFEWALKTVDLGAGEIMVTSIDRDGTGKGFDLELIRKIADAVPVPVIASGGAGRLPHVSEVVAQGKADAISLASMLHYGFINHCQYEDSDFCEEGNIEFLRQGNGRYTIIEDHNLKEVKAHLLECGIQCREQT